MDKEVLRQRREKLLGRLSGGCLFLPSAPVARRNGDTDHTYRQESDLLYLTGFREPSSVLVMNPASPKPVTLFVRPRSRDEEVWTGRRSGVEGAAEFGADQAFPIADLEKEFPKLVAGAHTLYSPLGLDAELDKRVLRLFASVRDSPPSGIAVPEKLADLGTLLHELRLFKDAAEIAALRRAADLTRQGHIAAMRAARPGAREHEVEAELIYAYRKGGGVHGYDPIVASGDNSTVLHYTAGSDEMRDGDLLLVDSGCELDGYTCDVTRTYPIGREFSRNQQALYEIVLQSQADAIAMIRPGVSREAMHTTATRTIVAGLIREGLLTGTVDSCLQDKSFRKFFMHGTSHWLGMDVHDVGAYATAGTSRALAAGMVLTVEPGIYVRRDEENVPDEFKGIGIRIEDDVLVTSTGCEILTPGIPSTVDELRRVRG